MKTQTLLRRLSRLALLVATRLHLVGLPAQANDSKEQAMVRLAASHDPEIPTDVR